MISSFRSANYEDDCRLECDALQSDIWSHIPRRLESAGHSETSVLICQTAWHYILEDSNDHVCGFFLTSRFISSSLVWAVFFSHPRHYGTKAAADWRSFICVHAHYASWNCIIKNVYLIQRSFLSCCVHFALVCVLVASLCLPVFRIFLYIVLSFYLHLFVHSW